MALPKPEEAPVMMITLFIAFILSVRRLILQGAKVRNKIGLAIIEIFFVFLQVIFIK